MAVLLFSLLLSSPSSSLPLCLSLLADAPLSMPLGPCLCLPLRAALALTLQTVANLQHMHKGRTVKGEGCGRVGGGGEAAQAVRQFGKTFGQIQIQFTLGEAEAEA